MLKIFKIKMYKAEYIYYEKKGSKGILTLDLLLTRQTL